MTNQLTQKQIDNRAYYAKHAEAIRAKKRAAYAKTAKPRQHTNRSIIYSDKSDKKLHNKTMV